MTDSLFPTETTTAPRRPSPVGAAVGAYCRGVHDQTGLWPDNGMKGQMARRIKALVTDHFPADLVAEAAYAAGHRAMGPTWLSKEVQRLTRNRTDAEAAVACMHQQKEHGPLR